MTKIDKLINEPSRMKIICLLYSNEKVDFSFLKNATKMTDGNLSTHLKKLEKAGYINIKKTYVNNKPKTYISITRFGKTKLKEYIECIENVIKEI